MKSLEINLTNYVQDLYAENYKTLLTGNKDLSRRKKILCSWLQESILRSVLPFNEILIQISEVFLID